VVATWRGATRGLVVWLGTLGYLLYQAVLFCFATPLNGLFLCYIAYLGLAVWSIVALVPAVDLHVFGSRVSARMPARFVAGFALAIAALNAAVWLAAIVPALLQSHPESLMKGTGLLTNPVYVQDLAIWLPLLAAAAVACWRRRGWGLLVTGAMLAMFTLEGIGVATDQWFGSPCRSVLARGVDDDGADVRGDRRSHRHVACHPSAQHRPIDATQLGNQIGVIPVMIPTTGEPIRRPAAVLPAVLAK
jgi:hypothetical protein